MNRRLDQPLCPVPLVSDRTVPLRTLHPGGLAVLAVDRSVVEGRHRHAQSKRDVTFSDAITTVRRWLWLEYRFSRSPVIASPSKTQARIPVDPVQRLGPDGLSLAPGRS